MALSTPDPMRWRALALLCAAQFIVILDTSIIGVALPAIQSDLGFTDEGLSWIFNAYVIAFGGLLLLGGKLAEVFGARRIFLSGFAILTAASVLAGLAESQSVLLAGRSLQGVGAALIAPAALTILMRLFGGQPAELGKAFGFWGASAAAGGTRISMDGKGRCLDNIFIERLWRSLKYECVYLHAWETGSQAKAGIGRWITFYNHHRPHTAHGGQPPAVVYFNHIETDQQVQAVA